MSTSTIPATLRSNAGGSATRATGVTSEEIHALLSLPFTSTSHRHPSYRGPSDNLSEPPQSAIFDFHYRSGLQPHAGCQESNSEPPQPGQNTLLAEAVISSTDNHDFNTPYDDGWSEPDLPKYADFATIFTKEEYMALAICYDIYGLSTSKIVAADNDFETRRAAVLDLFWRFQSFDILQSMRSLDLPGEFNELRGSVSFHYSDITWSSSSQDEYLSEPRPATPVPTHFAARLEQGDIAARLLQINEASLSRRGNTDQGIRKWNHDLEWRFRKRHGEPSPLESDLPLPFHFDSLEIIFQDLERRSQEKKGKKSTSSSSSYETKSGYHSRSSSFSSESHIPGSIRGSMEFPFGYPMSIADPLLDMNIPAAVIHGDPSAVSSPPPSRPKSSAI